jgi:ABC-type nitrate/sulfonate/bicarbonate transport system ATPase subunit
MATDYAYTVGSELVKIDGVDLTLGGNHILNNVKASVKKLERADQIQGQVICYLGPSGIGKTRLSRIIAGLDQPTKGRVLVNVGGQMVPVHKGMVGMVPQNYPLFEYMTVLDNLKTAANYSTHPLDATKRIPALVDELGLSAYVGLYPIQLSGGTRQRVAIVRQLLCSDHFIVMDEPFSGLDPIMKQRTCDLITKIATMDGLNTMIIVTHDVTEGMAVADTCWMMGHVPGGGASIVHTIDMAAMGICWHPDIYTMPAFINLVTDTRARFKDL